jgi:hypothetical protein
LQFNSEAKKCTNNIVEYEVILLGLRKLRAIGVQRCTLRIDSKVVAGQIEKECIARDATIKKYLALVRRMENYFKGFTVEHVDRNKNTEADELTKTTAHNTPLPVDIFLEIISDVSIKMIEPKTRIINVIQGEDWRAPIMAYLHHYYELDTIVEQIRMQQRARAYQIVGNDLYKVSVSGRCISKGGTSNINGGTHSSMRRSHQSQSISRQSFAAGFLLANGNRRRIKASVHMQSMPTLSWCS